MTVKLTQHRVPGMPKGPTSLESHVDIQLRDDENKHWNIATVHEMSGCSDPSRDVSLAEAEYYATLFQAAPQLLEHLCDMVKVIQSQAPQGILQQPFYREPIELCQTLIQLRTKAICSA